MAGRGLELEWVYGYHRKRSNLYYTGTGGEIVYFVDNFGVVYTKAPEKKQRFYKEHTDAIMCLALHPDKRHVATGQGGVDPFICVWDTSKSSMTTQKKLRGGHTDRGVAALAFSADGKLLASVGPGCFNPLNVWDWMSQTVLATISVCTTKGETNAIQFNPFADPEQPEVVTCGTKHIKFWTMYREEFPHLIGHDGSTNSKVRGAKFLCLAFSHEQEVFYTGTLCGCLYKWKKHTPTHLYKLSSHKAGINTIHVCVSGITTGSADGAVDVFSPELVHLQHIEVKECVQSVCREDQMILVGTKTGEVVEYVVRYEVGTSITQGPTGIKTWVLAAQPHKPVFAAASDDDLIRMFDSSQRKFLGSWHAPYSICSLVFSPDGAHLAAGVEGGYFLVFNANKMRGKLVKDWTRSWGQQMKYFSDGQYFAVGSDQKIDIYLVDNQYQYAGTCYGKLIADLDMYLGTNAGSSECPPYTKQYAQNVITEDHMVTTGEFGSAICQWKLSPATTSTMKSEVERFYDSKDEVRGAVGGQLTCNTGVIDRVVNFIWPSPLEGRVQFLTSKLEDTEKELKKREEDNRRLRADLNAVMRDHEGKMRGTVADTDPEKEYRQLFTSDLLKIVKDIPQGDRMASEEFLCKIFQDTYDHVSEKVRSKLQGKLNALFMVPKPGRLAELQPRTLQQMNPVYSKLLYAADYVSDYQPTEKELEDILSRFECHQLSPEKVKVWVTKSWQLAWKLVTSVPPIIASCPEKFDAKTQNIFGRHRPVGNSKPVFSQPVLYTNCLGHCSVKGAVRMVCSPTTTSEGSTGKGNTRSKSAVRIACSPTTISEGNTGKGNTRSKSAAAVIESTELALENVMKEVVDVLDWYALGGHLGIKSEVLDKLSGGASWGEECLRNMIKHWLSTGCASWKSLVSALMATGEELPAEIIKRKYCSEA